MPDQPPTLAELLARYDPAIAAQVRREAGVALLRFDSADDLIQGVRHEALRAGAAFRWEGEPAFVGWLQTLVRRHLAARRDYWFACKRDPAALLRLSLSAPDGGRLARPLADTATGPATFAARRDQLVRATRAFAALLPRDQQIIRWTVAGLDARDIGRHLGLSDAAADKARTRALERLRGAFSLASSPSAG